MISRENTNPYVFLDVYFDSAKAGRIVIELFKDIVPKTVENFRALCTGDRATGNSYTKLHYVGTQFHRVVPQFLVQGGDVTHGLNSVGESIYGQTFPDENFIIHHDVEGIVGMANQGPNTNSSQFYITTVPCPHLDGINVAFGKVVKGLNIIIEMSDIPRQEDKPLMAIRIVNSGEFQLGEPWNIEEDDETEDKYPPWPNDWDIQVPNNHILVENAIENIKQSGNYFFKKNNYIDAERKYKKGLRYLDWYALESKEKPRELEAVKITLLMNLATVKLKLKFYKEVVDLCNQILMTSPENGKALYRRAQAKLALKDYDKALNDLNMAISIHPQDKNIQNVLSVAKRTKLSYLKKERKVFSKLFK